MTLTHYKHRWQLDWCEVVSMLFVY